MTATNEATGMSRVEHADADPGLHLSLEASRELVMRLDSVRDSPFTPYHSGVGVACALAKTLLDMLEEIASDKSPAAG